MRTLSIVLLLLAATAQAGEATFTAHEWGTFTTLQDDQGNELPGINIDDEPVPAFVHNLSPFLLNNPILSSEHWSYRQKGAPRQHPMVTMRLETPVIYFHLGKGGSMPEKVDVDVSFRGGWLTEFYPYAKAEMPGLGQNTFDFGALTPQTMGKLLWRDVRLNTNEAGPETDSHVWLAPRNVKAVDVSVMNPGKDSQSTMEHERYLFYRGVANQHAPLRVSTDRAADKLTIRANFSDVLCKSSTTIQAAWLVDIRPDGQTAFRALPAMKISGDPDRVVAATGRSFSEGDYATKNLDGLKEAMHASLVADGLYDDEATAMLATWERAYFKTPGLRLFFTVPREWTDYYLPLSISGEPELERVMIGRIELVADWQRELLTKVSAGTASSLWIEKIPESAAKLRFLAGRSDFGELGVQIPENYQAYLQLGRFRNALVIAELKRARTTGLAKFVDAYSIRPYDWSK